MAARSSHNNDDGGNDLVGHFVGENPIPNTNEFYSSYWIKFESTYNGWCGDDLWNAKQIWFDGTSGTGHLEILISGASDTRMCFIVTGTSPTTVHPGDVSDYPCTASNFYNLGDWARIEFYIKLSTGEGHLNSDGIIRIKINGVQIYETTNARTGQYSGGGADACPAIDALCSPASGAGWWQIDDIEVWAGTPNSTPCVPNCSGKTCGDNGCGGSCGTCSSGQVCTNYQCVAAPDTIAPVAPSGLSVR